MLETVGLSWQLLDSDFDNLNAVTPADIQAAAQRFFTPERSTTLFILPEEDRP